MRFFPLNKNTIALTFVTTVTVGFFIAGLFDVLDYFIITTLLIGIFISLVIIAISFGIKNDKKNRPEDKLQDDSN